MQPINEAAQTAHTAAAHASAPWPDTDATRAHHLGHHRQCPCCCCHASCCSPNAASGTTGRDLLRAAGSGVLAALHLARPSQKPTSCSACTAMMACPCPCPSPRLWDHHATTLPRSLRDHHATMPRWSPRSMGKKRVPCPCPVHGLQDGVEAACGPLGGIGRVHQVLGKGLVISPLAFYFGRLGLLVGIPLDQGFHISPR